MSCGVMRCVVVAKVKPCRQPHYGELLLGDAIAHPMISHVDCLDLHCLMVSLAIPLAVEQLVVTGVGPPCFHPSLESFVRSTSPSRVLTNSPRPYLRFCLRIHDVPVDASDGEDGAV